MPNRKIRKRLRKGLMKKQLENMQNQSSQPVILRQEISETFQGPLPDPEMLDKYKIADPSFPERIMRMAEAHNAADVKTKYRISFANMGIPIIGQIFTLMLGAGSIIACVYLAKAGYTGGAIAAIVGGFSPIVINAFKGLRQNKR
jgi:uncharacterized membrane protein